MQFLDAFSLAPDVNDWMANTRYPRILHIFDRACNLINERREVLSVVTPQIRNGPFNLVVEDDVCFSDHLSFESPVSVSSNHLNLGSLVINPIDAKLWNPRPDWKMLHARKDDIANQIAQLKITNYLRNSDFDAPFNDHSGLLNHRNLLVPQSLLSSLSTSNLPSSLTAAQKLAGLGVGLTPSGDDFIMGAIYAAWIIHPSEVASVLAQAIANTAAPLTTSLSAAWLRSAGKGDAGIVWHEFFDALVSTDLAQIQETMKNILAIGETSGADALSGFIGVFASWRENADSSHG
jgi:hypothetical protein